MNLGKNQRAILAPMQSGARLCDDNGMWSVILEEGDTTWSGRVGADACKRLLARGLVAFDHTRPQMGLYMQDRDVYVLTESGRAAR
jgi:hypothetical protein